MGKARHKSQRKIFRLLVVALAITGVLFVLSIVYPVSSTHLLNSRNAHAVRFSLVGGTVRFQQRWQNCYGRRTPSLDPSGWFWLLDAQQTRNPLNTINIVPRVQRLRALEGGVSHGSASEWQNYSLPLWIPATAVFIGPGVLRFQKQFVPGSCKKCGYPCAGPSANCCPECGTTYVPNS